MAEEVPTPPQPKRPIYWKEMNPLEKALYLICDYIPIVGWVLLGLAFLYFGGQN